MEKDTKVALEILGIIFVLVYLMNGVYGLYHHMFTTPNFNEYVLEQGLHGLTEPIWYLIISIVMLWRIQLLKNYTTSKMIQ